MTGLDEYILHTKDEELNSDFGLALKRDLQVTIASLGSFT